MITPQLQGWALSRGFRLVRGQKEELDVVECPVNGYIYSINSEVDASKSSTWAVMFGVIGTAIAASAASPVYVVRLAVDHQSWDKHALKEIKKALKGVAVPAYVKNLLTLTMKKSTHVNDTYEAALYCMHQCAGILAERGVRMPETCSYCKSPGCDTFAPPPKGAASLLPAHDACVQNTQHKTLGELAQTYSQPSFLRGLPWMLLGVLLGLIVPIILPMAEIYMLLNMVFYALIPIIAFSMYQSHGGAMNAGAFVLVFLLTGAAVFGLVIWGDFQFIRNEYGKMPFGEYAWLLTEVEYLAGVVVELMISWVAGLAGVLIGWFSSRKARRKKLARLQAMSAERFGGNAPHQAVPTGHPPVHQGGYAPVPVATAGKEEPRLGVGIDD